MRIATVFLFFVIASRMAQGAVIDVRVVVRGQAADAGLPDLHVEVVSETAARESRRLVPMESREAKLDLEQSGISYLRAKAPGYWGDTRAVIMPFAGERIDLHLWPAATLRGRLTPARPPGEIAVRFQSAEATPEAGDVVPSGVQPCSVEEDLIECVIPAGHVDYSIRAPGHVPIHLWSRTHRAGEVVDLRNLNFRKGSSLLGRVTLPVNWRNERGERIRVELKSDVSPSTRPGETARSRISDHSAAPDSRGNFLFEGVPPGGYEISASGAGLISERRAVTIIDGLQAELRDPLALVKPLAITLRADPPKDPWGTPWTVELSRINLKTVADVQMIDTSAANEAGEWTRTGLTPGDYVVKIRRVRGVWHSQIVHIGADADVSISIPLAKVVGTLKLGTAPLAGTIWFGGELGEISIPIRTNPDGSFKAYLPIVEDDVWRQVDVAARSPYVRTTLTDVRVEGPDPEGISTVDLVLPANRLYGEVITEAGKPASSNATVFASIRRPASVPLQADVDEAGVFSFTGLEQGAYVVYAAGEDGKSIAHNIDVGETTSMEIELALRADKLIRGAVQSRYGAVAGARVSVYPQDRTYGTVQWDLTDFNGRFEVPVEPDARNVTLSVLAPGFAYTLTAIPSLPAEPLTIHVEQDAGRIVANLSAYDRWRQPYLFHGRAFIALSSLEHAHIATRDGPSHVLANIAPGHYDICIATPADALVLSSAPSRSKQGCLSGFVARGSVLALGGDGSVAPDAHGAQPPPFQDLPEGGALQDTY